MLRSYRLHVFALGLVLSTPAYSQEAKTDQNQTGADIATQLERISTAIEKQPVASAPDRGCDPAQEDRQSDLCAQWKSADAAADSARWARFTFFAGIIGLLVGAGTLFAAWRAAHWAKKAADHTEAGANAAMDAINEAREANAIAGNAQRPWIFPELRFSEFYTEHIQSPHREEDWFNASYEVKFRNAGKTIAFDITSKSTLLFAGSDFKDVAERQYDRWRKESVPPGIDLMPGETAESWGKRSCSFDSIPWIADDGEKRIFLLICTAVYYRIVGDPDGAPQRMTERTYSIAKINDNPTKTLVMKESDLWTTPKDYLSIRSTVPRRTT